MSTPPLSNIKMLNVAISVAIMSPFGPHFIIHATKMCLKEKTFSNTILKTILQIISLHSYLMISIITLTLRQFSKTVF